MRVVSGRPGTEARFPTWQVCYVRDGQDVAHDEGHHQDTRFFSFGATYEVILSLVLLLDHHRLDFLQRSTSENLGYDSHVVGTRRKIRVDDKDYCSAL